MQHHCGTWTAVYHAQVVHPVKCIIVQEIVATQIANS